MNALTILEDGATQPTSSQLSGTPTRRLFNQSSSGWAHKNGQRSATRVPISGQNLRRNRGAETTVKIQKQTKGDGARALLVESAKRVNGEGVSEPAEASLKVFADISDWEQDARDTRDSVPRMKDPNAGPDAQLARAVRRLTSDARREDNPDGLGDASSGMEFPGRYAEGVKLARRHAQNLEMSASVPDLSTAERVPAISQLHKITRKRTPRQLGPLKMRCQKRVYCTRQPVTGPGQHELPDGLGLEDKPVNRFANLWKTRGPVEGVENDNTTDDAESATEPATPGNKQCTKDAKAAVPPPLHECSMDVEEGNFPTSNSHQEANSSDVQVVPKRTSGMLSGVEHEQLAAFLTALRSRNVDNQTVDLKSSIKMPSECLPSSPYQHVRFRRRPRKRQATGEAKQRLQDNPWAQWLASPVRRCQATATRLPRDLMVGWNFVRNPKDEQVYLMPEELTDMAHLVAKNEGVRSLTKTQGERNVHEAVIGDSTAYTASEEPKPDALAVMAHSADSSNEEAGDDGIGSSTRPKTNSPQTNRKPPIAPSKLYMRPSSILLLELNRRIIAPKEGDSKKDSASSGRYPQTNPHTVSRLFPSRWKDQARMFEKSANTKDPHPEFLTLEEMRRVQWHPRVHEVMLKLLRVRVLKALESVAVWNRHNASLHRRIIALPLADSDGFGDGTMTSTFSGIEQAVFLWLGSEKCPERTGRCSQSITQLSPSSPPIAPSTCHNSTLSFVPDMNFTKRDSSTSVDLRDRSEQGFIPIWTHNPTPAGTNQTGNTQNRQQTQYLPFSITLHLPDANSGGADRNKRTDYPTNHACTRAIPIFDLHALLGESSFSDLHGLPRVKPLIGEAFGLNRNDASGWVMVRGGARTRGFKNLVHELWRLWLFVGGRRCGEDEVDEVEETASEWGVGGER